MAKADSEVEVFDEVESGDGEKVRQALIKALGFLNRKNVKVEVSIVSDKVMREMNKKFRGKDEVTNVLSFEEPEDFPHNVEEPAPLGEIFLAVGTIREKGEDILRLAVHGLLHLMGYTHKGKSDTMEMEKLEEEIIRLTNDK